MARLTARCSSFRRVAWAWRDSWVIGVRKSNPAEKLVREGHWPDREPIPIFLDAEEDMKLQEYVQPQSDEACARLVLYSAFAPVSRISFSFWIRSA